MKTNFKYFTLAIVALLMIGVTSCSKDDVIDNGDGSGKETKSVFLKISNGPSTRAEVPTQTAEPVVFKSGHLYFTDNAGVILRYHSIGSGADFTVDNLTEGQNITNLPSTVTQVYVVGNTNVTAATKISDVKAQVLQVESQGTISNVNLYGEDTEFTSTEGNKFTAEVTLAPTVARIELTDITAKADSRITGFEVEGIFIDNYFSQAVIGGSVDNANLVPISTTAADYMESTKYPAALNPSIYDWYTSPLAAESQVAKPSVATNVWGYNVFANNSAVPRIVIRLKNIVATGGLSFTSPQFLTIKGLHDGTNSLSEIQSGHVYNIAAGALEFDETNLTPAPNMETIEVEVTVTVADWVVKSVTPEL